MTRALAGAELARLLATGNEKQLLDRFRWQTCDHQLIAPCEMETRHLFFTLAMIWNHTMPYEARTHNFKQYAFGPFYTREYMITAIRAIASELATRQDMEATWVNMLHTMLTWLKRWQLEYRHNPARRLMLAEMPDSENAAKQQTKADERSTS